MTHLEMNYIKTTKMFPLTQSCRRTRLTEVELRASLALQGVLGQDQDDVVSRLNQAFIETIKGVQYYKEKNRK